MKYLDLTGLTYFWGKIKARLTAIENQLPSTISGVATNTNTGSMELWSQNLNNIVTTGVYNAMTCTNSKYTYAVLIVYGYYLSGYCIQIEYDVTTAGKHAVRHMINGSWTAWQEVGHMTIEEAITWE